MRREKLAWVQVTYELHRDFQEPCCFHLPGTVVTHAVWEEGISRLPTKAQVNPPLAAGVRAPEILGQAEAGKPRVLASLDESQAT